MVKVSVDEAVELLYAWALAVPDYDAERNSRYPDPASGLSIRLTATHKAVVEAGILACGVR